VTRIRRLAALAAAGTAAGGVVLLGLPSPAYASSNTIESPSSGAVVRSAPVTIKVDYQGVLCIGTGKVTLSGPSTSKTVFSSLSACQGPWTTTFTPTRNGTYTLKLTGNQTGSVYKTTTFKAAIPPAAPSGVTATASSRKINVRWARNSEPDITGYTVSASGASSKAGSCSGSTCSASLSTSRTGLVTVTVTAKRAGGVSSSASSQLTIGSNGSSTAPSIPTGTTNSNNSNPSNNVPVAPITNLPTVAPDGSNPTFPYTTPTPRVAQMQPAAPKAQNVASVSSLQWGKSIAIALILLVCAAHLGMWTRRLRIAQAGGPGVIRLGRARVRSMQDSIAQAEEMARATALAKDSRDGATASGGRGIFRRRKNSKGPAPELGFADESAIFETVPDQDGLDQPGLDQHGLEQHGLEQHGLEQHGLEQHGLDERASDQVPRPGWISSRSCRIPTCCGRTPSPVRRSPRRRWICPPSSPPLTRTTNQDSPRPTICATPSHRRVTAASAEPAAATRSSRPRSRHAK